PAPPGVDGGAHAPGRALPVAPPRTRRPLGGRGRPPSARRPDRRWTAGRGVRRARRARDRDARPLPAAALPAAVVPAVGARHAGGRARKRRDPVAPARPADDRGRRRASVREPARGSLGPGREGGERVAPGGTGGVADVDAAGLG